VKLSLTLPGEAEQYVICKDKWTRRDLRAWYDAMSATPEGKPTPLETASYRLERALELLRGWCTSCRIEDVDGNVYTSLDDITPDAIENMDGPVADLLTNLCPTALAERSKLGEVKSSVS